jgi:hypothetical protein
MNRAIIAIGLLAVLFLSGCTQKEYLVLPSDINVADLNISSAGIPVWTWGIPADFNALYKNVSTDLNAYAKISDINGTYDLNTMNKCAGDDNAVQTSGGLCQNIDGFHNSGEGGGVTLPNQDNNSNKLLITNNNTLFWDYSAYYPFPVFDLNYTRAYDQNLQKGDTNLYTVPTGKKAQVYSSSVYNQGTATVSYYPYLYTDQNYRIGSNSTVNAGATSSNNAAYNLILTEGQKIGYWANNAGVTILIKIVEFDANTPIKSSVLYSMNIGDNNILKVPTGKRIVPLGGDLQTTTMGNVIFLSNYAGTNKIKIFTAEGVELITGSANISTNTFANIAFGACLIPGDTISVNTTIQSSDTNKQISWFTYAEADK